MATPQEESENLSIEELREMLARQSKPTVKGVKGKVIITSTPNGSNRWIENLRLQYEEQQNEYKEDKESDERDA